MEKSSFYADGDVLFHSVLVIDTQHRLKSRYSGWRESHLQGNGLTPKRSDNSFNSLTPKEVEHLRNLNINIIIIIFNKNPPIFPPINYPPNLNLRI